MRTLSARKYNLQIRRGGNGWLCRVQVNSEQEGLQSFAEAGERLCGPDSGMELVPPLRWNCIPPVLFHVIVIGLAAVHQWLML